MPDPLAVATFRFEVIAPLLDPTVSPTARRCYVRDRGRQAMLWPSGDERPVARSTLYRWLKAYRRDGLAGLTPRPRRDRGTTRTDRKAAVDKAVQLLLERPERSVELVLALLRAEDPGLHLSRSTLQRDLARHPGYAAVRRQRKGGGRTLRTRFEAAAPHDIWQLDAKGPVTITIAEKPAKVTVLSILDDSSRALLAVTAATREKLGPAVRVFRDAAANWGLPARVYCDRHSVYDSNAFRSGLAVLGVHRIASRSRNPQARGKIERYHQFLDRWFLGELAHQEVVSFGHLEELLQAFRDVLYNGHHHRGLKATPGERLAGRESPRDVTLEALERAFWVTTRRKAHPRTGEVRLPGGLFRVPKPHAGRRVKLRYDPDLPDRVVLVDTNDHETPLQPLNPQRPTPGRPVTPPSAPGRLQQLLDRWRGRDLPVAPPAFGLPEIFAGLSTHVGRTVPKTAREAETVQRFYRVNGPFRREDFEAALRNAAAVLGTGRPLQVVLAFLVKEARRVRKHTDNLDEVQP